jgi:hypothetical protein
LAKNPRFESICNILEATNYVRDPSESMRELVSILGNVGDRWDFVLRSVGAHKNEHTLKAVVKECRLIKDMRMIELRKVTRGITLFELELTLKNKALGKALLSEEKHAELEVAAREMAQRDGFEPLYN